MRRAYGGRAAAYEKHGDFDRAAADYGTIVFSYVVEVDLADPKADGYDDLLRDAAKACRKPGSEGQEGPNARAARGPGDAAQRLDRRPHHRDREQPVHTAGGRIKGGPGAGRVVPL
jgi:hypothetical protein